MNNIIETIKLNNREFHECRRWIAKHTDSTESAAAFKQRTKDSKHAIRENDDFDRQQRVAQLAENVELFGETGLPDFTPTTIDNLTRLAVKIASSGRTPRHDKDIMQAE